MKVDIEQTYQFIEALTGGRDESVCWHPLHDSDKNQRCKSFHGSVDEVRADLERRNREGWGIFIAVNVVAPGANREATNVIGLRALFIDCDGGELRDAPLAPSFRVHSARGDHLYWVMDKGESVARFTVAQKHLARYYGTDTTVSDLPRLMRVPGFTHNKGEPKLVTFEADSGARYSINQVIEAHHVGFAEAPVSARRQPLRPTPVTGAWEGVSMDERKRQCMAYLRGVPPAIEGSSGDRRTFQTCAIVMNDFAVDNLDDALEALADWNARCAPPWDTADLERKLFNSSRYSREPKGSRLTLPRVAPPSAMEPPAWLMQRGSR